MGKIIKFNEINNILVDNGLKNDINLFLKELQQDVPKEKCISLSSKDMENITKLAKKSFNSFYKILFENSEFTHPRFTINEDIEAYNSHLNVIFEAALVQFYNDALLQHLAKIKIDKLKG